MEIEGIITELRPYAKKAYGDDAEDLLHDAYLKIIEYKKLKQLEKANTIKLVLKRMLYQLFIDKKRKQKEYNTEYPEPMHTDDEVVNDYVIKLKSLTFEQREIAKQLMAGKTKSDVARYFGVSNEVIKNECKKMKQSKDWVTLWQG